MAGLAVEVAKTGDEFIFTGRCSAGSETGFDSGRSGVVKLNAFQIARQDFHQLFEELYLDRSGKVVGVHQGVRRFCHRFRDFRVAVAEGGYVDAAGEVDVLVAIDIFHRAAETLLKDHRAQANLSR